MLTKVCNVEVIGDRLLRLQFSDGSEGVYDMTPYVEHDAPLTAALRDPVYFRKVFIDEGAVTWPNGLDFSGWKLQRDLDERGLLKWFQEAS